MKINVRLICTIAILLFCIVILSFAIYHQIFPETEEIEVNNVIPQENLVPPETGFDELFDNKIDYQNYNTSDYVSKLAPDQELVYTAYTINDIYEDKYELRVNIPMVNINNQVAIDIDKEIINLFYSKANNILTNAENKDTVKTIYTVDYTACLNENILSLVIEATLKEGNNPQRVIIQTYTYNLSTNERPTLKQILSIQGINEESAREKIKKGIKSAIDYADSLKALGYEIYKRDINNQIYEIDNTSNYFFGKAGTIYAIYAYGNSEFTSERDVVVINKE